MREGFVFSSHQAALPQYHYTSDPEEYGLLGYSEHAHSILYALTPFKPGECLNQTLGHWFQRH